MHNEGYFHRDLKPENVVINRKNGNVFLKLCDFGLAKQMVMDNRK